MNPSEINIISQKVFNIDHSDHFNELALEIFYLQHENNTIYRNYCDLININASEIKRYQDIPFIPVEFFKTHRIATSEKKPEHEFHSSGTTNGNTSVHLIFDKSLYRNSILYGFRHFYEDPKSYCFIALMPSLKERPYSSLAFMADLLIRESDHTASGFYMGREKEILKITHEVQNRKLFIFGLSYALADLAKYATTNVPDAIIMETGGMKGRRKEIIREELHTIIKSGFGTDTVHSEYSMCELFSQAYSKENGIFTCPPWMKVLVRDINDPFSLLRNYKTGGLNIIDLANIHTCSFIATQDLGRIHEDGYFEVLGRFDNSDLRGCSLLL